MLGHRARGRLGLAFLLSAVVALAAALPAQAETRTPGNWPFAASSPWNASIGTGAQFTSPTCNSDIAKQANYPTPWIDTNNGLPVYFASSTDPSETYYQSNTPQNLTPTGTSMGSYHVPVGAKPGTGDLNMAVVEPDQGHSDESFDTHPGAAWVNVMQFSRHDLVNGDGFSPLIGFGPRAADASLMGGEMRTWEIQAGSIRHALALVFNQASMAPSYVAPAKSIDNNHSGYAGSIPMGQLIAIPSSTSIASLGLTSSVGTMIATALQQYGAYIVDTGGSFSFTAEPSADTLVNGARGVTNGTSDLYKIIGALRCVSNNQGPNWGGGGTPLAPPPPPFG